MIRVVLPAHLRTLVRVDGEVTVSVGGEATANRIIDALEQTYPALSGTIRDHLTRKRRPLVRFFVCSEDVSHASLDAPLPLDITSGREPFVIVGAIAGG